MPHDLILTCLSIHTLQLIEGRNLAEEQPSIKPAISLGGGLALTTLVNRNKLDLRFQLQEIQRELDSSGNLGVKGPRRGAHEGPGAS